MNDHSAVWSPVGLRHLCALSCFFALALGVAQADAQPGSRLERSPIIVLAQASPGAGQEQAAAGDQGASADELADLKEVLAATQARLEELFAATATLAEQRQVIEALRQENERLAAALEEVKAAVFAAGAGRIGQYDSCCWQVLGKGQFRPLQGSEPFIGQPGRVEEVAEWKVELVVADELIHDVVKAMKKAHPYQTPAFDVWRLSDLQF